ncbi:MAG: hypothetical protein WCY60_05990 [Trueperaceae bacterium]
MRLVELEVTRLPGVHTPFRVGGMSPHVTVVVGPNASGKSSLVRALRALWDEKVHAGQPVDVRGEFSQTLPGGERVQWRAQRVGPVINWERAGQRADPPPAPVGHLLESYLISVETLMQFGDTEASIGDRLRREMSGGYDLAAAADLVQVQVSGHRNAATRLRERRANLADLERNRAALRRRLQQKGQLTEQQERAAEKAAQAAKLKRALELAQQHADLNAVTARLQGLPGVLAQLSGSEDDDLAELNRSLAAASQRRAQAARAVSSALEAHGRTGFAELTIDAFTAETLEVAAVQLSELVEKMQSSERAMGETRSALQELLRRLGGTAGGATRQAFEAESVERVEAALGARMTAQAHLEGASAELERLRALLAAPHGAPQDAATVALSEALLADHGADEEPLNTADQRLSPSRLAGASSSLANWLAAEPESPRPRPLLGPGALLAGGAALLAGAAVVALEPTAATGLMQRAREVGAWFVVPALLGSAAALAGVVWGLVAARSARRNSQVGPGPGAESARLAYARTGARAPLEWSHDGVARRLEELLQVAAERREAAAQRAATEAAQVVAARRAEQAQRELTSANAELTRLAAETGYDAGKAPPGAGFAAWLRDLRLAADLDRRRREIVGGRKPLQSAVNAAHEFLTQGLAGTPFEVEEPEAEGSGIGLVRVAALREATKRLKQAVADVDRATAVIERAEAELKQATEAERTAAAQRSALLERCGLDASEEGAESKLHALMGLLQEFQVATASRLRLEALVREGEEQLAGSERLLEAAAGGEVAYLSQAAAEAEAAAPERDRLMQELGGLTSLIDQAEKSRDLERAHAEVELAQREVAANLRQASANAAVEVVLQDVEEEHQAKRHPEVLKRAARWFLRFTHGAFELEFEPGAAREQRLRARESASGKALQPAELSTGTRAQLLLALRVAYATLAEEGSTRLPFFLDEALTTADAHRFAQVATSLLELSQADDRQIIYLSARKDDAAAWRDVARQVGASNELVSVIDLAEVRGLGAVAWEGQPSDT